MLVDCADIPFEAMQISLLLQGMLAGAGAETPTLSEGSNIFDEVLASLTAAQLPCECSIEPPPPPGVDALGQGSISNWPIATEESTDPVLTEESDIEIEVSDEVKDLTATLDLIDPTALSAFAVIPTIQPLQIQTESVPAPVEQGSEHIETKEVGQIAAPIASESLKFLQDMHVMRAGQKSPQKIDALNRPLPKPIISINSNPLEMRQQPSIETPAEVPLEVPVQKMEVRSDVPLTRFENPEPIADEATVAFLNPVKAELSVTDAGIPVVTDGGDIPAPAGNAEIKLIEPSTDPIKVANDPKPAESTAKAPSLKVEQPAVQPAPHVEPTTRKVADPKPHIFTPKVSNKAFKMAERLTSEGMGVGFDFDQDVEGPAPVASPSSPENDLVPKNSAGSNQGMAFGDTTKQPTESGALQVVQGDSETAEITFTAPVTTEPITDAGSKNRLEVGPNLTVEVTDKEEKQPELDTNGVGTTQAKGEVAKSEATQSTEKVKSEPNRELEKVIPQIVDRAERLLASKRPGAMTLYLEPRNLGEITVTVQTRAGRLDTEIKATNEAVRAHLDNHKQELVEQVAARGIQLGSLNVGSQAQQNGAQHQQAQTQFEDSRRQAVLTQALMNRQTDSVPSTPTYASTGQSKVDWLI